MRSNLVQLAQEALFGPGQEDPRPSLTVVRPAPAINPERSDASDAREAVRGDSDSLTFDPEAPLVANLFDRVRLAWLRSARAGSAPEAGLAWLEAQARDLAPDLGEDDLAVLVTRALGRLCALSPAPGRDLAERAWDLLGGEPGRQEEPLPAPARPDLFLKVDARELVAVVPPPSPPEGLPETCPACKSRSPKWKAIEGGRRFLCGRCWKGLDWPGEDR